MDNNEMQNAALEPIAIIGMSGHFPGAKNIDELWENVCDGVNAIKFFPKEVSLANGVQPELVENPDFVRAHGTIGNLEMFDANFFNMTPREAKLLDPQHRMFLECAWEALENAGYNYESIKGHAGVYGACGFSTYLLRNILPNNIVNFPTMDRFEMAMTNQKDTMPMRVSFMFDFKGPSMCVSTTCSTSLVNVHLACRSLLSYECDLTMAGASYCRVPEQEGHLYQEGMIYSKDGYIRTFDVNNSGTVAGSGTGIIVLKRLREAVADGDFIHGIILSSALNNDGSTKIGYAAPSIEGQTEVITEAISLAGIDSSTITFVEVHGTGTKLGDPIEITSLNNSFRATTSKPDRERNSCVVASTKPNIGHLNQASGMAGLIKAVMGMQKRTLPPSINFTQPNPSIDFEGGPFYVSTAVQEWKTEKGVPRRSGVNSFGIGGTNAHVVLEEAPPRPPSGPSRPWQLLLLSAKSTDSLEMMTANLAEHLKKRSEEQNFADIAYTLQIGRKSFEHRRVVLAQDVKSAIQALEGMPQQRVFSGNAGKSEEQRPVAFMFSGQGSQYVNMGLELYRLEPIFKEQVDICCDILQPHLGLDLRELLYPNLRDLLYPSEEKVQAAAQQLQQTAFTQPALFVIEYALAKLWMAWGIQPSAMIGHSIGEYVAACLAGVFSLEDALSLVANRGRLMQQMPSGEMLAVPLPAEELQAFLTEGVSLAAVNGVSQCVASGPAKAIEDLDQRLKAKGVNTQRLKTSHAFHSGMMDPILAPFTEQVEKIALNRPQIPYISNVTGTWITAAEATDPSYWATHLRQAVRFAEGIEQLLQSPGQILLEVGPGRTLNTLAKQHPRKAAEQVLLTSLRHPQEKQPDVAFLLTSLGKLWLAGIKVDWSGFYTNEQRMRVPLPTYAFDRKRYWIDPPKEEDGQKPQLSLAALAQFSSEDASSAGSEQAPLSSDALPRTPKEQKIAEVWQFVFGLNAIGIQDNFFDLGGDSLLASRMVGKLSETFGVDLSVQELLSSPTIAELASILDIDVSDAPATAAAAPAPAPVPPPSASLVKLKKGEEGKRPLFLVHPIDGQVFAYLDLVTGLDAQRPVYGLQALGLAGETEPLTQVSAMATRYIEAIRTVQPEGPYLFGGFSFGGLVAFEMAQQLQAAGQKIDFLFMIDTMIEAQEAFGLKDETSALIFLIEHLFKLDKVKTSAEELKGLSLDEQVGRLLAEQQSKADQLNLSVAQVKHMVHVIEANKKAVLDYAVRPYPGRLVFFRPKEVWKPELSNHSEQFWLDFVEGGLEINTVPGNHLTMNDQPNVQVILRRLEEELK
uniref:Acyl transferase domain-containing protein n=1 Tax=Candidatus Kentrum sp. FM TaxID=2126340 RepID=A0A450S0Y5_9GAMM|nr:MAG: Acyl transferase domain-containing protein [Candidatus Kentron sp. FM]VFJ45309.1 MAG: Acyl transferase domain-containing protein [Candidatus Kentron sp. FM]VFK05811.1 MAG: Acyl transferase domain-containing protein [Candidatus Kentron sp. FM]